MQFSERTRRDTLAGGRSTLPADGMRNLFHKKKPAIAFKHEGIQIIQQTVSLLLHLDSISLLGQFVRDFFFFYFETSNEEG